MRAVFEICRTILHSTLSLERVQFWPAAALIVAAVSLYNVTSRLSLIRQVEAERAAALMAYTELAQSQSGTVDLVGRTLAWPSDVRPIRPEPEGYSNQPYRLIIVFNSLQCRTLDPVTELLRSVRRAGHDAGAGVVIHSPDPWTAESYARANRLRFSVWHDANGSFVTANAIKNSPLAMIVDSSNRVVTALTASGRGRDLWQHVHSGLLLNLLGR